jgi:hypothetical protein
MNPLKEYRRARWWWCMPLIPALGRQRQVDFWVQVQPCLQSEFQDSQGYTEKPCLGKKTKTKTNKQTKKPKKEYKKIQLNRCRKWIKNCSRWENRNTSNSKNTLREFYRLKTYESYQQQQMHTHISEYNWWKKEPQAWYIQ